MHDIQGLTRRSMLIAAGGAVVSLSGGLAPVGARQATPLATPMARVPLWQTAWERGLIFGTSTST